MRRRRYHNSAAQSADIDITAFMNLMVILVPFLLITAVFSRITILELNLPAANAAQSANKPQLQLELVIRSDRLELGDRNGGLIKSIAKGDEGYDLAALSTLLQQLKARYPEKRDITLLLEAEISYDTLVEMMDAVRLAEVVQSGSLVQAELFPEIAVGDAPLAVRSASR
ncbi:biopolymer transporter ExbD [Solemya pervernicosa gill symbiont]|uniref:Biopolymer transporter ExbD n=1 Tax=Solemya pervernicosa gill symbiont TaxID=642797 RepID=A0A1T2L6K1_9GAMM|nr:biopolymer transporter ExbD [Solemya pervernicosa gill symbiont]OOZ40713.1 biopolymer transporter ExbD [Solemya pervernicosa gill symbiont]